MRRPRVRFTVRAAMAGEAIWFVLVFGCVDSFGPGPLDYSYDVSGGYQASRSSSHQVEVVPKGPYAPGTPVIPPKVVEIAWDESCILAKQQLLRSRAPNDGYKEAVPGRFSYWILDLKGPTALGPFTDEGFRAERIAFGIDQRFELKGVGQFRPR